MSGTLFLNVNTIPEDQKNITSHCYTKLLNCLSKSCNHNTNNSCSHNHTYLEKHTPRFRYFTRQLVWWSVIRARPGAENVILEKRLIWFRRLVFLSIGAITGVPMNLDQYSNQHDKTKSLLKTATDQNHLRNNIISISKKVIHIQCKTHWSARF